MNQPAVRPSLPAFHRLIWLLPVFFAVHIVEEYVGGFPGWVTHVLGGSMDRPAFIVNNAAFMAIMLVLTLWASKSRAQLPAFLLIAWSSGNIFWDSFVHILSTAAFDRYSPGLITSAFLYFPLSLVVAVAVVQQKILSIPRLLAASAVGAALILFVIWAGLYHFAL